jgi:hypothetical protein
MHVEPPRPNDPIPLFLDVASTTCGVRSASAGCLCFFLVRQVYFRAIGVCRTALLTPLQRVRIVALPLPRPTPMRPRAPQPPHPLPAPTREPSSARLRAPGWPWTCLFAPASPLKIEPQTTPERKSSRPHASNTPPSPKHTHTRAHNTMNPPTPDPANPHPPHTTQQTQLQAPPVPAPLRLRPSNQPSRQDQNRSAHARSTLQHPSAPCRAC